MLAAQDIDFDPDDDDFYYFLFHPEDFTDDTLFNRIAIRPELYLSSYKAVIMDKGRNPRTKLYALLAMQRLDFESYLQLMETTFEAYKQGAAPYQILHLAAVNAFGWSDVLSENRKDSRLRAILKQIWGCPKLPEKVVKSIESNIN